ncbi:PAS domain-containing protein [Polaromonas sp. P2-4]|nr:PAS domain-containing protein [Polaromonas sp. P2-4]
MTTDPLGIITDVNQQMAALTGNLREELIGSPFKNYFTDPQRAEDGIRLVLRQGTVTNYELTARAKDGHETVVSYNAITFNDAAGNLQGVFAGARHHGAEETRTTAARPAGLQPRPHRVVGGRTHHRGPGRHHLGRERPDVPDDRLHAHRADWRALRRLLHRARARPARACSRHSTRALSPNTR